MDRRGRQTGRILFMQRPKMEDGTRRLALVVLGMHRSGTSAMAGCLAHLGARRPRTEIAPTVNNPRGYCESEPVMVFNDRLLELMGSVWHDWRRLDPGLISAATRRDLAKDAAVLLAGEFGDADVIVLKDPRLCRLMPLWEEFLDLAGYEARYVLPVRHPLQSALSLRVRNAFSLETGRLLWLRHVLEAERRTRGQRRHILAAETLVAAPQATLAAIARELGLAARQADMEGVAAFIEPALFHCAFPAELPSENRWIAGLSERVHAVFQAWETEAAPSLLDAFYAEFDAITGSVAKPAAGLFPAIRASAVDGNCAAE